MKTRRKSKVTIKYLANYNDDGELMSVLREPPWSMLNISDDQNLWFSIDDPPKWFFCDETGDLHGPYTSIAAARVELDDYTVELETGHNHLMREWA